MRGWSNASRAVGRALAKEFPGIEARFAVENGNLLVEWRSENEKAPYGLRLSCIPPFPTLHWNLTDIGDFPLGDSPETIKEGATGLAKLLKGFFEESVVLTALGLEPLSPSSVQEGRAELIYRKLEPEEPLMSWRGRWDRGDRLV